MSDIDKYFAEKCGIRIREVNNKLWYSPSCNKEVLVTDLWTIQDQRIRELIRNWWLSQDKRRCVTMRHNEVWYFVPASISALDEINAKGTNEIECLTAIYEARDDL